MDIINSSFAALPPDAAKFLKASHVNFFSSYAWYQNFVDTVVQVDGSNHHFLISAGQGLYSFIFPLQYWVEKNGCRQLKSLANYYSPIYELIREGAFEDKTQALYDVFCSLKTSFQPWDVMALQPMSEEDVTILAKVLKQAKIPAISFFCFGNWYLEVNGRCFSEYFSELPSRVKNTATRKTKQFEKLPGTQIMIYSGGDNLAEGIAAYLKVYGESWKKAEPYPDFMPGLIKAAAAGGHLRLGIAYLDGQPIAAQVWIVANNSAYIFKLAYDERYKNYAAGTILTTKMLEFVIDSDKVAVVDYLCGDDAYKSDWMSHRRERWGLLAFNPHTFRGNMEMLKEMSKRTCKNMLVYGQKRLNALQDKQLFKI